MKIRAIKEDATRIHEDKRLIRILPLGAIVLCVAGITTATVSLLRIHTHQKSEVCLIQETTTYQRIHTLSAVLPALSIVAGLLAAMRWKRSKNRRRLNIILAVAATVVSIGVLIVYWMILTELAARHLH